MFSSRYYFSRSRICDGRRTNRGDNAVGSAVWRPARTTDGNQKLRIFIFDFYYCYFQDSFLLIIHTKKDARNEHLLYFIHLNGLRLLLIYLLIVQVLRLALLLLHNRLYE